MNRLLPFFIAVLLPLGLKSHACENEGAQGSGDIHLFVLAGQSNMQAMNANASFIPIVAKEFGKEHVLVVKEAEGSQPIRRWYKGWKAPANYNKPIGDLYDHLMDTVKKSTQGKEFKSVTFVWLQGERDAQELDFGDKYEENLRGLLVQVRKDFQRDDVNFVIGRISDHDNENKERPRWSLVREAQVKVAESESHATWINTDDLNDGLDKNGLMQQNSVHYSTDGYRLLGERFAQASVELIRKSLPAVPASAIAPAQAPTPVAKAP